jgi:dolichol-phosphate mannosyltransferase
LPPGFTTLVVLLLVSISLNAIFLGIIGEYISRMYEILFQKPMSLIEKSINLTSDSSKEKN